MTWLLAMLVGLVALILLAGVLAFLRLKSLAGSPQVGGLVDSFDDGLAIPMRDCDTRRARKENP